MKNLSWLVVFQLIFSISFLTLHPTPTLSPSLDGHYLNIDLFYENLCCYTGRRWPRPPPRCQLQGSFSSHNSTIKSRSQWWIAESLGSLSLGRLYDHIHTFPHACMQICHPPSKLSWLIRFLSYLFGPESTDTALTSLDEFRDMLPPSSLLPPGLQCVGVQQCVIGFSAQLCSLKPPPGSVGESQLQQGWAWPAGGCIGGR